MKNYGISFYWNIQRVFAWPLSILCSPYCASELCHWMSSYLAPSLSLSLSYLLYPYFLSHFRHSCLLRLECEVHAPCCGEPQCIQRTSHHTAPYAVPLPGTHESPVNAILTAGTCHSNTAVHRFSSYHLESGMDCMVSSYVTSANHSMYFTSRYNFSTVLFQVAT